MSRFCMAAGLCLVVFGNVLGAHGNDLTDLIASNFKKNNHDAFELHVSWKTTYDTHAKDRACINEDCVFAIKGSKRLYTETLKWVSGPRAIVFSKSAEVFRGVCFDGVNTSILLTHLDGQIWKGNELKQVPFVGDFISVQGYHFGTLLGVMVDGRPVKNPLFESADKLIDKSDYRVGERLNIDGVDCVSVEGSPPVHPKAVGSPALAHVTERLCFDPLRHYALLQRRIWLTDNPRVAEEYRFMEFREVRPSFWLASRIEKTTFEGDSAVSRMTMVADTLSGVVSDDVFSLPFRAGTTIVDGSRTAALSGPAKHTHGGVGSHTHGRVEHSHSGPDADPSLLVYRVPADVEQIDKTIEVALARQAQGELGITTNNRLRPWIVWGNLALVVVLLSLLLKKKLRVGPSRSAVKCPPTAK
jgi:hypothetical protein